MRKTRSESKLDARLEMLGICQVAAAVIGSAVVGAVASSNAADAQQSAAQTAADAQTSAADKQYGIANRQQDLAEQQYQDYKDTYQPLEHQLVNDAQTADSNANQQIAADRASSDVIQAYDTARANQKRQLTSFGVNPNSGRADALDARMNVDEAAAQAGAQNNARQQVKNLAYAKKIDAASIGKGLPAAASSGLATAASTTSAAGGNMARAGQYGIDSANAQYNNAGYIGAGVNRVAQAAGNSGWFGSGNNNGFGATGYGTNASTSVAPTNYEAMTGGDMSLPPI